MTNNVNNTTCNFSEALISYLYGEIGGKEKSQFEAHILNCQNCSDEISAFGAVRSSVIEWREKEFAELQTPEIILTSVRSEKSTAHLSSEPAIVSNSWLSGLREVFSFSRLAVACATLLVCAGLFYAAINLMNGEKTVAEDKPAAPIPTVTSPTVEFTKPTASTLDETKIAESSPLPEVRDNKKAGVNKLPALIAKQTSENGATAVIRKTNPKSANAGAAKKLSIQENKPTYSRRSGKESEIEFSNRVEEDKSLRLMDMFDEVSMR
jgi:hypothetical protein